MNCKTGCSIKVLFPLESVQDLHLNARREYQTGRCLCGTPKLHLGHCRGLDEIVGRGAGRRVPQRTRVARKTARRPRRRPQNKPTAVSVTCMLSGRKNGRNGYRDWVGWQARDLDVDILLPPGPPCRQNSLPSSVLPMRRSSSSSRPSPTLAARTATSRCLVTSGSGEPTVSA